MTKNQKMLFFIIFTLCLLSLPYSAIGTEIPKLETPIVVTTCGQAPGGLKIAVLAKRLNLDIERLDLLKANDLQTSIEDGTPFKTLIIVCGTSRKGMGAAGTDIDNEIIRIEEVIKEANKQNIFIIGAHIGGMSRRADETDEASIKAVIPKSDLLLIRKDGNEDKFFTEYSEDNDIPMIEIENDLKITEILEQIFLDKNN